MIEKICFAAVEGNSITKTYGNPLALPDGGFIVTISARIVNGVVVIDIDKNTEESQINEIDNL